MADVRGVWLPKSQKADISFLSSCGINRRIHHPTANSRLDDPESPVNTSRLIVTDRLDMDHFQFADHSARITYGTRGQLIDAHLLPSFVDLHLPRP